MEPKTISLKVFHEFKAAHSLEGFETPHFHLWKVTVEFKTSLPLKKDRLIDLVLLQRELECITAPLKGTFLNESMGISPTSENMAFFLWKKIRERFPDEPLQRISVALATLNGELSGEASIE